MEDKKKDIETQEDEVKKYLPELKSFQEIGKDETEAEIFKRWKGMEPVFNEMIKEMRKNEVGKILILTGFIQ